MIVEALWPVLPPGFRSRMVRRVIVTGAESTGTTTLALGLAEILNCPYVPEYGREYTEKRPPVASNPWRSEELVEIARVQNELEEEAARRSDNRWLIGDTDAMTTAFWHERYFGAYSDAVDAVADAQIRPYAYILTGDDINFEADNIREGGAERHELQEKLRTAICATDIPWIEVHGGVDERLTQAIDFLETQSGQKIR